MEYVPVLAWLATYLLIGLAAAPVAAALFPRMPDRGASVAVPLGLAVLGLVGYLVGHLRFGWVALLAGVAVLVAASVRFGERVDPDRGPVLEAAAVFSLAFLFLVAIRAVDPAVTPLGGEKFLDYGLTRTLLRADALPPEDFWFAGESVRYYYGGHVVAALLSRLTLTSPRLAYNLALAGFYAALVTAAYGLAGAVADAHGTPRRLGAGLGAFFVGIAGNLYTIGAVLLWLAPAGVVRTAVRLGAPESAVTWSPDAFHYWSASRIIPGTINEFPLFAWLNGDLHAHMMSTTFTLLVCALLFAYWRTPAADRRRRRLLVFGVLPPLAGFIAVVNTWSFPTVALGLPFLALAFAPAHPGGLLPRRARALVPGFRGGAGGVDGRSRRPYGPVAELVRSGTALAVTAGVLALAVAWVLPFWFGTASGRPIGFFPTRSGLGGLLVVHGAFLFVFVPYLLRRAAAALDRPATTLAAVVAATVVAMLAGPLSVVVYVAALVAVAAWYRNEPPERVVTFASSGFAVVVGIVTVVEFGEGPTITALSYLAGLCFLVPVIVLVLRRADGDRPGPTTTGLAAVSAVVGLAFVTVLPALAARYHAADCTTVAEATRATCGDLSSLVQPAHALLLLPLVAGGWYLLGRAAADAREPTTRGPTPREPTSREVATGTATPDGSPAANGETTERPADALAGRGSRVGFETLLVLAGAGIVLLVEFVYVAEPQYAGSVYERLNTVFKTYMQVWVLWGVAGGAALARLASAGLPPGRPTASREPATADGGKVSRARRDREARSALDRHAGAWRLFGRGLVAFLVFTTALYAGFAVPNHFERTSPTEEEFGATLDATAFVYVRHPGEAEAILGVVDRFEGQPNIVTAAPAGYRWNPSDGKGASAPASLTGVPTVAGWHHERQYRSPEAYEQRVDDVRTIFTGQPADQRELLAAYDVEYVYVGPAERARYGDITVQRLDAVTVHGEYGDVVIYEVDQSQL